MICKKNISMFLCLIKELLLIKLRVCLVLKENEYLGVSANLSVNPFAVYFCLPVVLSTVVLEVTLSFSCEFPVACVVGYMHISVVEEFAHGWHSSHPTTFARLGSFLLTVTDIIKSHEMISKCPYFLKTYMYIKKYLPLHHQVAINFKFCKRTIIHRTFTVNQDISLKTRDYHSL